MKRQWKAGLALAVAVILSVFFSLLGTTKTASAANPTTMSFQGKVVNADGTNVTDGTYSFLFKLYVAGAGGTAVWSETQSTVTVAAGVFQVNLGANCSFFVANACNNNTPVDFSVSNSLYLGITFNADPAGEMTPRVQLQSVPYAFQADNAGKVGGFTAAQLVQLSPASQQAGFINVNGASTFAGGLTVNGGAVSINASGTNNTILGGASGTLGIGGATAGAITLQSGSTFAIAATNIALSAAGAISGGTSYTGSGNINTTAGVLQTNTTTRIDNAGNIVNAGNFTATAGTTFATTGANGFLFKPGADNASAFQIQDATGWQILNVDTTYNGLISNPGFEVNTSGWLPKGANITSFGRTIAQNYYGIASAQIVTNNPANNNGASFAVTLLPSTQYTLSAYARVSTATATTLVVGRQDVSGTDAACTTSVFPTVTATGWARLTCTFTTGATITSSNIFVKQTDNTGRTYFVDGFKLETGATATPYRLATISARGVVNTPQSFQNSSDSTTALQVTNAAGASLFNVDTVNNTVSIGNGITGTILNVDLTGTATAHAVCHPGTGATENQQLVPCSTGVLGADYAELYPSQTNVEASDIVSFTDTYAPTIDGKQEAPLLAKTQSAYDHNQIGVISEAQVVYNDDRAGGSQVIGYNVREQDHPQPLALNGRVMTKVSAENGTIAPGDYITASSVPGVGMKATHAGEVVGRALGSYSDAGPGKVLVFINPAYYVGDASSTATAAGGSIVSSALTSNGGLTITSGSAGDITIDSGAADGIVKIGGAQAIGVNLSHAGATTAVNGALRVDESSAFTGPVTMHFVEAQNLKLGKDLTIDNTSSDTPVATAIQISNSGGAGFTNIISTPNFAVSGAGDVTANTIAATAFTVSGNGTIAGGLNVGSATVSGGLRIGGDLDVSGLSTFQKLATFLGKTIFRQDVQFDGHLTVAKDGAGYASIRKTESTVPVTFKDEYAAAPVVTAAITNGTFASYTIDHVTTKGFDITLKAVAESDITFSWTAVGVIDPQTASNPLPVVPAPAPAPPAAPAP